MDSPLRLFLCPVIVLFEAFRPSFKIARSTENKPYLGTVTMLLSIGNNIIGDELLLNFGAKFQR